MVRLKTRVRASDNTVIEDDADVMETAIISHRGIREIQEQVYVEKRGKYLPIVDKITYDADNDEQAAVVRRRIR
jgi:hypothetical protein